MNTERLLFNNINNIKASKGNAFKNDHLEEIDFDLGLEELTQDEIKQENVYIEEEFPEETTILLKNFDPQTTNEDLLIFFSKIGKFRKSCFFIDKYTGIPRFIYIEFYTHEEKIRAQMLNHTMLIGKLVKIEDKRKIPSTFIQKVHNLSLNNTLSFKAGKSLSTKKAFNPY